MHEALHERWPALTLHHVPLGTWPTPVRPVASVPGLWVKDEGLAGPEYGGNKVRKLEFILADARARGQGDLVTVGGVGSHHVIAMAIHARRLGLRPWAALYPQVDSPSVRRNARLIDALCEDWTLADSRARVPAAWLRTWGSVRVLGRARPYIVAAGGSSAHGTVGWVAAGLEIADAVGAGHLPEPRHVVVPLGSGGTAAGLALGLRLGGLDSEVVAVRVVDRAIGRRRRVHRLIKATASLLAQAGAPVGRDAATVRVEHAYFGAGYGRALPLAEEVVSAAGDAEIALDETYAAKAFAAAVDLARDARTPVLFVATANRQPLDTLLGEALPEVPRRFEPLLQR